MRVRVWSSWRRPLLPCRCAEQLGSQGVDAWSSALVWREQEQRKQGGVCALRREPCDMYCSYNLCCLTLTTWCWVVQGCSGCAADSR
jgi:hypothetical protein